MSRWVGCVCGAMDRLGPYYACTHMHTHTYRRGANSGMMARSLTGATVCVCLLGEWIDR